MLKENSYILVFSMAVLLTIILVSTTPENQLYLRKSEYICETPVISAKFQLYLRKSEYICNNNN
ncbi:hypothetical protein SRABI80_04117 [Peribacillus frigoritolerans]|nr:hypothetical protein SRABI80_04117 [Peribacillus frigoritolerans]